MNKTQVLHCMRLRFFTPRLPIPDVQTTSQQWKPDPKVIIKHDDLYARVWESQCEKPIFDNNQHEADSDNPHEITVTHDSPNDKTCTIPGTIQEDSPEIFPHTDEIGDRTDTNHYVEPEAETSSEQMSPTNNNPRSTKYDLRHNPKPSCIDDCRY